MDTQHEYGSRLCRRWLATTRATLCYVHCASVFLFNAKKPEADLVSPLNLITLTFHRSIFSLMSTLICVAKRRRRTLHSSLVRASTLFEYRSHTGAWGLPSGCNVVLRPFWLLGQYQYSRANLSWKGLLGSKSPVSCLLFRVA